MAKSWTCEGKRISWSGPKAAPPSCRIFAPCRLTFLKDEKKEDEILYPWMDRNLSVRQVGELFARFLAVDERFAEERKKKESFVGRLEEAYAEPVSEVR